MNQNPRRKLREAIAWNTVFLGPLLLCFVPIVLISFFIAIYMSLMRWDGISSIKIFIGLTNYKTIFTGELEFWKSVLFSTKQTIVTTLISNILGLSLALLVCSIPRIFQGFSRTMLLLPNIMGGIIMGFIWRFIFQKGFAALSQFPLLGFLAQSWLGRPKPAFWAIIIVSVWQFAGYTMTIYIAGLVGISSDIKDAVKIDGCGKFREFYSITIPLIMPSITVCIFWVMVKTFTMYDLTAALTEGGPFKTTMTVSMDLYAEAFTRNNYGLGSAKAIIFFIFILIISVFQVRLTRTKELQA